EFAVNRGDYDEVLSHDPDAIDLTRQPLPLIEQHDHAKLNVGTVENLRIVGRKLRGVVRFGSSARARELWDDVKEGIVRSVSVGYRITEHVINGETLRATRWAPHEVSLVAVPADPDAGLNRSRSNTMSELNDENLTPETRVNKTRSER